MQTKGNSSNFDSAQSYNLLKNKKPIVVGLLNTKVRAGLSSKLDYHVTTRDGLATAENER